MTAKLVIKAKEAEGRFDIFLSHNSKDKAAVEKIAKRLLRWDFARGWTNGIFLRAIRFQTLWRKPSR